MLSAREMAGFLTALLQAALLLQERLESQCLPPGGKRSGSPHKCCPMGNETLHVLRLHKRPQDPVGKDAGPGPGCEGLNPGSNTY